MKALTMCVAVIVTLFFLAMSASACEWCQRQPDCPQTVSVPCPQTTVCEREIARYRVVEQVVVTKNYRLERVSDCAPAVPRVSYRQPVEPAVCGRCHQRHGGLCHAVGHVVDVGRAAVRTVAEVPSRFVDDVGRRWDRRDHAVYSRN